VQLDDRLGVRRRVGVQAAEEGEFIDVIRRVPEQLRHPRPRPAVLPERELRRHQLAAAGAGLAVLLLEARLVLPGVHLRDGTGHEQEDDPLGLRLERRLLRGQRPEALRGVRPSRRLLAEQARQRQVAEARPGRLQHVSP